MKLIRLALASISLAVTLSSNAFADSNHNIVRIMAPIAQGSPWLASAIEYAAWQNVGSATGCTFSPLASEIDQGVGFEQKATGCTQHQTQTVTQKETNKRTGEVRVVSTTVAERDLQGYSYTLQKVGEKAPAYQCGVRDGSNYWNEYFTVTGVPLGMAVVYNGAQIINNYNVSGAPISESFVDPASGKTLTRGGRTDIGQSNGITTGYYQICHTN